MGCTNTPLWWYYIRQAYSSDVLGWGVMRRLVPTVFALLSVGLWLACGDDGDGSENGPVSTRESYPNGYGTTEGRIIDDLEFVAPDNTPFTLNDVFADGHNRLLLLESSAAWCTVCLEEQPQLVQLHEEYADEGLSIVLALFENDNFEPANAELAFEWQQQHDLPFLVVADPAFIMRVFYGSAATPVKLFIDVETMEIVRITAGYDPILVETIVEAMLR